MLDVSVQTEEPFVTDYLPEESSADPEILD